ncbi:MAG: 5'-nucleotidase C-terminal domain-containing protein [Leptolyngbyaceae bacterium]|nr:5'-nucleotidase C-terminal domain-containing protein [Leptolyngbyaceae bacterium]
MFQTQSSTEFEQELETKNKVLFRAFDDDDDNGDDDDDDDNDDLIKRDGNIFGFTRVFIEGRSEFVSKEFTTFGGLTTAANLFVAKKYDASVTISITSASSITNSIGYVDDDGNVLPTQENPLAGKKSGDISQLDIERSLQFNHGLALVSLTRRNIVQILEYALSSGNTTTINTLFPQVTGLSFSYDLRLPVGQRVRSLCVKDDSGKVIDIIVKNGSFQGNANKSYRVVTTNYLANGGDGYLFPQLASNRVDLTTVNIQNQTNTITFAKFGTEQYALADYLASTYRTTPFSVKETTIDQDVRIQNLSFRSDTVVNVNVNQFFFVGGKGKDKIRGGNLDDILRGAGGNDRVIGQRGHDDLYGNNGNDRVKGGHGNDDIEGGKGNDKLIGSQGDDIIDGGKGNDIIIGSKGDDRLFGGDEDDRIQGGAGDDEMSGDDGDDRLLGGRGNDIISGGEGDDFIVGGQGDDVLQGDDGDDILLATGGNTLLDGGDGDDLLVGGRGNDTFVISGSGTKTIREFCSDGSDRLFFKDFSLKDLSIEQSGKDTVIQHEDDILAVLLNVQAETIDQSLINSPDSKTNLPERLGKPTALTFEYVGGTDLLTGQSSDKATVNGDGDDDELAYIVVSDRKNVSDVFDNKGKTYFKGDVELGEEFTADVDIAGTKKFKSKTFIYLFDDVDAFEDGDEPLQSMQYHTSGSEPMRIGDVIGGVELTLYVGELGVGV